MDEKLILYLRDYCGYCAMVQDVISELAVDVEERNIWDMANRTHCRPGQRHRSCVVSHDCRRRDSLAA